MNFVSSPLRRLTATLLVLAATAAAASAQTPLISGEAGTGVNTFYFDVDFRDFSGSQYYAFAYYSNAATLTFADILSGLSTVPTFSAQTSNTSFGLSLDGISYDGKTKNGSSDGGVGYWSQWRLLDGTEWKYNEDGIGTQVLNAGQWAGASWVADYRTVSPVEPRVALTSGAASPEPVSAALALFGGVGVVAVRRRRPVVK